MLCSCSRIFVLIRVRARGRANNLHISLIFLRKLTPLFLSIRPFSSPLLIFVFFFAARPAPERRELLESVSGTPSPAPQPASLSGLSSDSEEVWEDAVEELDAAGRVSGVRSLARANNQTFLYLLIGLFVTEDHQLVCTCMVQFKSKLLQAVFLKSQSQIREKFGNDLFFPFLGEKVKHDLGVKWIRKLCFRRPRLARPDLWSSQPLS